MEHGGNSTPIHLQETLDSLENGVDKMRENARSLRDDKEAILSSIHNVLNSAIVNNIRGAEREELELRLDHLVKRCLSVEVCLTTVRNQNQEQAFHKVMEQLKMLNESTRANFQKAKEATRRYLNSCLAEPNGPIDDNFQSVLLECTAEDQKQIRKKLEIFIRMLDRADGLFRSVNFDVL